jgi:predicted PurR-regulated permease PerM
LFKSKVHFWTLQILLVLLIFYVSTKVSFLFQPFILFVTTLFFPILIAGILFFIFNPIVALLQKRLPRTASILLIYLVFILLVCILLATVGPIVTSQITDLFNNVPRYVDQIPKLINSLYESQWYEWILNQEYVPISQVEDTLVSFAMDLPKNFSAGVSTVFGVMANITLAIVTVPFILFYMLKDGSRFPDLAVKILPVSYQNEGLKIFHDLYSTLAAYIQGQLIVCLFVGTGCFIGYSIIGLNYALILGIVVAITNIIPYLGPFIGAAPAVIIALFDSPTKALLAIVVVVVVQQIDGNLISPLVIGKRLNTHPLTIILLLIGAGSFGGILGMILAVPVYAVLKAFTLNVVRLIRLRQRSKLDLDKHV